MAKKKSSKEATIKVWKGHFYMSLAAPGYVSYFKKRPLNDFFSYLVIRWRPCALQNKNKSYIQKTEPWTESITIAYEPIFPAVDKWVHMI